MKTVERGQARTLRAEGRSIKEIARMLGVAPSSVSLWVRDIELTAAQHNALEQRNGRHPAQRRGNMIMAARARHRRRVYQEEGRMLARRGDAFHAAGCMLYWAEGEKGKHVAGVSNSDPEVLRFFVAFLRKYFRVSDEKLRVTCNLHADHVERQRQVEDFWLGVMELPRTALTKSIVNVFSKYSQRKRVNNLPYGTCRVRVCSTRIVQSIYGSIQEYGGFEREEWLL